MRINSSPTRLRRCTGLWVPGKPEYRFIFDYSNRERFGLVTVTCIEELGNWNGVLFKLWGMDTRDLYCRADRLLRKCKNGRI